MLVEIAGNVPHKRHPPLELPPEPLVVGGGGVEVPWISDIGDAAASLEVRVGSAQLFSNRCRTEYSS